MSDIVNLPLGSFFEAFARHPQLLIVDDIPLNQELLKGIFEDDHEVAIANSGKEALEICHQEPPDLILLDVVMPDMDGLELCRKLKLEPETRGIPVIFVTGQNSEEEENACWAAGGVDFIIKPFNPTTVRNRVRVHLMLKFQADILRQMAFLDGLTGVANRRFFEERLETEWRYGYRHNTALSLIMLDIDHFKLFNDYYGHPAGDECLKKVAGAIREALKRPHDLVARYGGEEFACILPGTDVEGAKAVAGSVIDHVAQLRIAHEASPTAEIVTVSLGVAFMTPAEQSRPKELLAMADENLYKAKQAGRNRFNSGDT